MNKIRIKIVSGYASPSTLEFALGTELIRIGRAEEAEVRMDPTRDTAVSRGVHAQLERSGDNWYVACLHAGGIGLVRDGGQNIKQLGEGERAQIVSGQAIEIGAGGPRIEVEDAEGTLPVTNIMKAGGAAAPIAHVAPEDMAKAKKSAKQVKLLAVVGAVIAVGVIVGIVIVNNTSEQRSKEQELADAKLKQRVDKSEEAGSKLDKRLSDAETADSDLEKRLAEAEKARTALMDNLRQAEGSVYIAGLKDTEGDFVLTGTVWVVGEGGVLATNAHVSDALFGEKVRERYGAAYGKTIIPVIRKPGVTPIDLPITKFKVHPGYHRWANARTWVSTAGEKFRSARQALAFDVALLYVEDTKNQLGPPLPLLGYEQALTIQKGTEIGYVGFPMENQPGLGVNRSATIMTGRISSMLHPLGVDADAPNKFILQHNAESAGGASGSPILNSKGQVVAVHNAGSYVFIQNRRASAGINYAQRVDLLRELLDGTADIKQAKRDVEMIKIRRGFGVTGETIVKAKIQYEIDYRNYGLERKWIQDYMRRQRATSAYKQAEVRKTQAYKQGLAQFRESLKGTGEVVMATDFTLASAGSDKGWESAVTIEPGYRYLIAAASEGLSDIDMRYISNGRVLFSRELEEPDPLLVINNSTTATFNRKLAVFAKSLSGVDKKVYVRIVRYKL